MGTACPCDGGRLIRFLWLIYPLILITQAEDPAAFICAVLLHEAGHILTALFIWRELPFAEITAVGFRLTYSGAGDTLGRIAVSAAGPAVSMAAGMLAGKGFFALYSAALGIINLFPISVLDGGSILNAVCGRLFSPLAAYYICRTVSVIAILVMFALNCAVQLKYGTDLSLAAVTVFLTVSVLGSEK